MLVFLSHDVTLIKCIHVRYQMKALVIRSNMKFESHFYLDFSQVILVFVLKLINHNTK